MTPEGPLTPKSGHWRVKPGASPKRMRSHLILRSDLADSCPGAYPLTAAPSSSQASGHHKLRLAGAAGGPVYDRRNEPLRALRRRKQACGSPSRPYGTSVLWAAPGAELLLARRALVATDLQGHAAPAAAGREQAESRQAGTSGEAKNRPTRAGAVGQQCGLRPVCECAVNGASPLSRILIGYVARVPRAVVRCAKL